MVSYSITRVIAPCAFHVYPTHHPCQELGYKQASVLMSRLTKCNIQEVFSCLQTRTSADIGVDADS